MSCQQCLLQLAKNGVSTEIRHLIATFMTDRKMVVKVRTTHSDPRDVCGGCLQKSILGVFLINATIDDFEEGSLDIAAGPTGIDRSPGQ